MKTIFVVGGGSSLEDFDFARLDNVETIAVNESFFSLNNPTYFVTLDGGWIRNLGTLTEHRERFKKFLESKAIKYYINPRGTDSHKGIDKVIHSHIVSPFDNEKFGHGYNSGFSATQLALQLGYEKIYLLGIDMVSGATRSHYHDKYPRKMKYSHILVPYAKMFKESLMKLPDEIRAGIISCSPISKLNDVIEYQNIDDVLSKTSPFDDIPWDQSWGDNIPY